MKMTVITCANGFRGKVEGRKKLWIVNRPPIPLTHLAATAIKMHSIIFCSAICRLRLSITSGSTRELSSPQKKKLWWLFINVNYFFYRFQLCNEVECRHHNHQVFPVCTDNTWRTATRQQCADLTVIRTSVPTSRCCFEPSRIQRHVMDKRACKPTTSWASTTSANWQHVCCSRLSNGLAIFPSSLICKSPIK